jgi:hypothetical protein
MDGLRGVGIAMTLLVALLGRMPPISAQVAQTGPCPTTATNDPPVFIPPAPLKAEPPGHLWHGTSALWTRLSKDGHWNGQYRPDLQAYRQKLFVWREGFNARKEPRPALTVIGTRLDANAPTLTVPRVTHAFAPDIGSAMLAGVDIPTTGCWQITASYGSDSLTFVVTVP